MINVIDSLVITKHCSLSTARFPQIATLAPLKNCQ